MPVGFPQLAAIRLGFGLSPVTSPPVDLAAVLGGIVVSGPGSDAMSSNRARRMAIKLSELGKLRESGGGADKAAFERHGRMMSELLVRDVQDRLVRAVDGPGFGERLVQFWSNHFTVTPKGRPQYPLSMAFVEEAIRPHLSGPFEEMFFAAETHPMMLVFLDQNRSRGPNSPFSKRRPNQELGLNENLAREALELHSMGVGAAYTQDDVRELAELFTGLNFDINDGFKFDQSMAEPRAETVLGVKYGGERDGGLEDIRSVLRDIARRPETAQYISRKLAVHFISDAPSPELVDSMAAIWRETNGSLVDVYRVMVTHPELASSFRSKIRQPFDYLAASFRALGVTGAQLAALDFRQLSSLTVVPMRRMGQSWSRQAGPDGWPEEAEAWITPQLLAARMTFALQMPSKMVKQLPDPRDFLQIAMGGTHSEQ